LFFININLDNLLCLVLLYKLSAKFEAQGKLEKSGQVFREILITLILAKQDETFIRRDDINK
jgi:hypothetical protein